MRQLLLCVGFLAVTGAAAAASPANADPAIAGGCPPLLARSASSLLTDDAVPLCQYRGKVLLIVNTASKCGFTPQYEGLEALYRRYQDRGLVVLGFPSNDFGGQEPGKGADIARFCQVNYGVTFPMFAKSAVIGPSASPLYRDLAAQSGKRPQWNFHKYLVDRDGAVVASFDSAVAPRDARITAQIERLLAAR